jgi:hypothetical protein
MFQQIATQSPVEVFVQKKARLGRRERMLSRFFQESDDLLALYARETLEKLLNRIASLQMIEKTLDRNADPSKDRLAAENFRILRYDAAHSGQNTASPHSPQNRFALAP